MKIRKYLITGLLVWLPLGATIFVVQFLVEVMDLTLLLIPDAWQPERLLGASIPGMGIIFALVILVISGAFVTNVLGQKLMQLWEAFLNRIPLVKSIYSGVKQLLETIFVGGKSSFSQVVMLEFPRPGQWTIGLVTGDAPVTASNLVQQELVSVIIATTPNPTSGFIVMVPKSELRILDMSVEDALKYVISMGVVHPEAKPVLDK